MRAWPRNRFVAGTYKRECDRCGFDYLRSELIREWDGLLVCPECFEEKDPQLTKRTHKESNAKIQPKNSDAAAMATVMDGFAFGDGPFGYGPFGGDDSPGDAQRDLVQTEGGSFITTESGDKLAL